jgi:TPR repeat protein
MTSRHKPITPIALIITTALLLTACNNQDPFTNQPEIAAPPAATEDKISQLQRQSEAGDPDAQYNLAYLYENGLGVTKDEAKALALYQQAADQGHPAAKNNLETLKTH